ncbi:MAG: hypothetical protein HY903_02310 [Deltaproteobacteria bacterium]|nr:hypothetical protein [Deltaproteobacteria bacterium]
MRRAAVAAVLGLATACGYRLLYADKPFGAAAVAVLPFVEDTPVGLTQDLALALNQRLAAAGVHLTTDEAHADAVLSGRLVGSQTLQSPAAGIGARVPAYDLRLQLQAWLTDRQGKELWRTALELSESFLPSTATGDTVLLETEANRRRALLRLADAAARVLVERLGVASAAAAEGS